MNKSELKVGDILQLRNEDLRKIGENNRIETITGRLVNNLCYYQDNLLLEGSNGHDRLDVVKVYRLIQEQKETLTEKEKEYLTNFIRPFSNKIVGIVKKEYLDKYEFIEIKIEQDTDIWLPNFKKGKYYKNMKYSREYSLEELGIEV